MSITPGARFGSFRVVGTLGAGGMGEVYRASDAVLKRDVALKVLPAAFATDARRLARFQREAELLAALNHANIAQVFGIETHDGVTAIVMELVEGQTLADRILQGPVPPDDAMAIALQVLAALEAAHAKHIVHRDLKPSNIKIRDDGTVKVLDFGISKAIEPTSDGLAPLPVTTPAVTATGVLLGTAAYMSPEQARGKLVDERTDIWAFGCLLFEMLTGQPAFGGEDVMLTLARVLDRATDLSSIPETISPAVRRCIELCLEKDPARRIADIRDVRLALQGTFDLGPDRRSDDPRDVPAWRRALVPGASLLLGVSIGVLATLVFQPEQPPPPLMRFEHILPPDQLLVPGPVVRYFDLAPDGSRFIYSTTRGVYRRERDDPDEQLIRGTEVGPVAFIAFGNRSDEFYIIRSNSAIERMSVEGGAATSVLVANTANDVLTPDVGSILWTPSGDIIIGHRGGISTRKPEPDARPELLIELDDNQQASGARFLPDGDTVLFALRSMDVDIESARIVAQSVRTHEPTEIVARGYYPRYVNTGHLLFIRDGALYAIRFDPDTLETRGSEILVVSDISMGVTGAPQYAIADDGTFAYVPRSSGARAIDDSPQIVLSWLDTAGSLALIGIDGTSNIQGRISPDGGAIAVSEFDPDVGGDIKVFDLQRPEAPVVVTRGEPNDQRPFWLPGGRQIIFDRVGTGGGLFLKNANGTGDEQRLTTRPDVFAVSVPCWISADGNTLIFERAGLNGAGLYALDIGSGEVRTLLDEPDFRETGASLSPDLRHIAYSSDRNGTEEIFISPYPDVESDAYRVSANGGTEPFWDPEGDLYYLDAEMVLTRVTVQTDPTLVVGDPEPVSRVPLVGAFRSRPSYGFDPASRRFLIRQNSNVVTAMSEERKIIVALNWTDWLKRELPPD